MAATRGRTFLGSIFFNDLYVLYHTLCKVSCFLNKMHDSGEKSTLAAPLMWTLAPDPLISVHSLSRSLVVGSGSGGFLSTTQGHKNVTNSVSSLIFCH